MTIGPVFRSRCALAFLAVLGGCVWLEPERPGTPVVVDPAVHCYSTIARPDCYGERPPDYETRRIGTKPAKTVIVPAE